MSPYPNRPMTADILARLLHETSPDCRLRPPAVHERAVHINADMDWALALEAFLYRDGFRLVHFAEVAEPAAALRETQGEPESEG